MRAILKSFKPERPENMVLRPEKMVFMGDSLYFIDNGGTSYNGDIDNVNHIIKLRTNASP